MAEQPVVGQIAPDESATPPTKQKRSAPRPIKSLPTDRLSFEKQVLLLRCYAVASGAENKAVSISDLASLSKLNPTSAGLNNTFLAEAGAIVKAGTSYQPATEVISFERAYQFDSEKAGHKLAPIFRRAWFGSAILRKVALGPITEQDAITELADVARATTEHSSQLRLLLEYLSVAGLIERDANGVVRAGRLARDDSPMQAPEEVTPTMTQLPQAGATTTQFQAGQPAG